MISRRNAIVLCGSCLGVVATGGWHWLAAGVSRDLPSRLAQSAADLVLASDPPEPWLDTRPQALAHVAMALEAVGEHERAAGSLSSGWRIAAGSSWGVSHMMGKLAWAAAYISDRSLSHQCLSRADILVWSNGSRPESRMLARSAKRIRERDFAYRIDSEITGSAEATCLLGYIEKKLAAGDFRGAVSLSMTRSELWAPKENATAQALLARVIRRPWELVVT